jgi:hypothetical protein
MSALAALGTAHSPDGASSVVPGERASFSSATPALTFGGATDESRWSFAASARREPWEAGERPGGTRLDSRDAFEGDATQATLAFEWQRRLGPGHLATSAFASRRQLGVTSREDGAAEHLVERDLRGSNGLSVRFAAAGWRAALKLAEQSLDADARLAGAAANPFLTLREDRLRQTSTAFDLHRQLFLAPGVAASLGARVERYRYDVRSDLAGRAGSAAGLLVAPAASLELGPWRGTRLFARFSRGEGEDGTARVAVDPRNRAPIGVLDPAADATRHAFGVKQAWGSAFEATLSFSRTRTEREIVLAGSDAVALTDRPARRDAVHAALRWHGLPWLTLDADATWLDASYADGAREAVPGAASRLATAGATVRPMRGWSASLFVSNFASGELGDGEGERLRSSTLVNGRLTHNLSKKTRVSLDVFNIFQQRIQAIDYHAASRLWGQPGMADDFLFHPAEPRGFRLRLRTTF